jgi:hypothetical protein
MSCVNGSIQPTQSAGEPKILTPNSRRRVVFELRHSSGFLSAGPVPSSAKVVPLNGSLSSYTSSTRCCASLPRSTRGGPGDVLGDEGHRVNYEKVQRLWREEGLKVPIATRRSA